MSSYLPENELRQFIDSLPTRRLASSALIRDPRGRVLIVEPNYRDGWTLPGGTVEAGEDPRTGCFREVVEEVGLHLPEGRLLVVAHGLVVRPAPAARAEPQGPPQGLREVPQVTPQRLPRR